MSAKPRVALTGATGFVGQALLPGLLQDGHPVSALARAGTGRSLPQRPGLDWIAGDLGSTDALKTLASGADVLIHLAGVTKAAGPQAFHEINAVQTGQLVNIARAAGVKHFIHVSSLTAIRPHISAYAASKAASERLATQNAGDMALTIVRAPAILGPGDEATRPVFSMLANGLLPVPAGAAGKYRFSVMDVLDLCRYLRDLSKARPDHRRVHTPAGLLEVGWDDIAASAGRATGRRIRRVRLPPSLMQGAGYLADFASKLSGNPQVFSSGKVKELLSGHWLAETQIDQPIPLDETLVRCLAPFLASGRQSQTSGRQTDGSET